MVPARAVRRDQETTAEGEAAVTTLAEHHRAVLDYYLGAGTAERMAAERVIEQAAAEKRDAIAAGRRREGDAGTWYANITWGRSAWYALHGEKGPRR